MNLCFPALGVELAASAKHKVSYMVLAEHPNLACERGFRGRFAVLIV